MDKYYMMLLNIKNRDYLETLKLISIYYKYGKSEGDILIKNGMIDSIEYEDIVRFIYEYVESNKILLSYFINQGLSCEAKTLEFVPSSVLSFQNTSMLKNITSIIKYRINNDEYGNYHIGTLKKTGVNIHDNFSYDIGNYETVLNNSIIDILKNFSGEHDFITDVHGIKFAEDNGLDFFSGYVIKNSSPLRNFIIEDFKKSVDKTSVSLESVIFDTTTTYTYGYVKRNKEEI